MKKLLEQILAWFAKKIVKKYQPKVVGITGSIGKTSAKEAIFAVLDSAFDTRKNIKNYNNEIGVPLTIIGMESGGRSFLGWLRVFSKAISLLMTKDNNYPEVLVLEMGADKPGDIGYLVDIAPCSVGVLTRVSSTHLEEFKTVENVAKEKQKIVSHLDKKSFSILNSDDPLVMKMAKKTQSEIVTYGHGEEAMVRSLDFTELGEGWNITGIKFKIQYEGSTVPVFLPGVVGKHQINSALIAAAVGMSLGMNLIKISEGLKNYTAPLGRMHLVEGANETLIIDDTYNSSPAAAEAAVIALEKLQIGNVSRKVVIMGDMLELGDFNDKEHLELGKIIAKSNIDILIAVGDNRELIASGAKKAGLDEQNIYTFENSKLAKDKINDIIKQHDLILAKGSQGSRMERVVKELMKDQEKAKDLLVRQSEKWLRS
jgi:UDP-N-acetylmuramoyl-tripeptide--D-alanyl-D-alanine ligase